MGLRGFVRRVVDWRLNEVDEMIRCMANCISSVPHSDCLHVIAGE